MWEWEKDSVLYEVTEYTATKDIFQAVCQEIGRYYTTKGMKYTKSNRKLKWKGNKIQCEFGFWSSCSNIPGKWVALEIVTSVVSLDKSDMERDGVLDCDISPIHFDVYKIDDKKFYEIITYIENTLESKEGLKSFFIEESREKFMKRSPNNVIYLSKLEI